MPGFVGPTRGEEEPRTYKGFVIRPTVRSAPGERFWFILTIYEPSDIGATLRQVPHSNAAFTTTEEAEAAAIRLAQQIIDEIPSHTHGRCEDSASLA